MRDNYRRNTIALILITFVLLIIGMFVLAYVSYANGQASVQHTTVDITVMPCSAWADEAQPVIPANTFTGACVNDDGTLSTP